MANKGLVWDFPCNVILMPTGVGGRSKRYFKNTQKHLGFLFCGINKLAYLSWILIWFIASKRKTPPNIYDVTPHLFATKTGDPFETFASVWNFFRGFSAGSVLGIFTPEPWGTDLKLWRVHIFAKRLVQPLSRIIWLVVSNILFHPEPFGDDPKTGRYFLDGSKRTIK